ncbi:SIMPL domain-containing protein [Hungatella sp. SB206]|uniref:SIMPL domain-containing protein n=1 Tax=Hungatella sp. SB206 TaxID=2937758 RepID=UPI003DAA4236
MRKHFTQTAVILAAVSAIGLTACTQGSTTAPIPDTIKVENVKDNVITVQSTEEVKVVPDMAELVFSVTTQAADAKACQEQNSKDLDNVISFLKGTGIAETSIQTSNYGLDPIYDWNSGRTITGYEMNTTITVSDIPIDQAGTLISSSVEAGINSISQVTYLSSKYDETYQQALKNAIASAKVKAEAIAEAGGCTLGPVVHVEEYNDNQIARYSTYKNAAVEDMAAGAASMSVEPGQLSVEARVTVEFEIQ